MSSDTRLTLTYELTNCNTTKYTYLDINVVMTITANDGFHFIENDIENYILYGNGVKTICNRYENVDSETKIAKITTQMQAAPTNATVHFVAYDKTSPTEKISVIQNLVNCNSNFTENKVNPNEIFNVIITADSDCIFDVYPPTYKINDAAKKIFTMIDDTQYTAEITAPNNGTITITATAEKIVYIPVTQNLISCNTNFTKNKLLPNETANIRLTPYEEYYFATIPIYKINNLEFEFNRLYDSKIFQADITAPTYGEIIINATAVIITYSVSYNLSNCYSDYTANTLTKGVVITITANEGYVFEDKNPPYYSSGTIDNPTDYLDKISNYVYQLDTSKIASSNLSAGIKIIANCIQEISPIPPSPSKSYGFIDIYLPSIDNLNELNTFRFTDSDNQKIDTFNYIFKCHKIFFNVDAEFNTSISLAFYRTNIICGGTTQTFLNVNCGSVFIPEKYNNVFDYQFTTSRLYLPFIGYREIDTPNIMNSNVTIDYKANIVDGNILAVISNDTRGELYQFEGNASFDIPYMINQYQNSINRDLYHNSAYLGNLTPTIQLITNKPYGVNNDNVFGYSVNQWCKIADCEGYIKCADIQLIIRKNFITNSEVQMITSILKEGVFV